MSTSLPFQPHFNGKVLEIRAMSYNLLSALLELTDNSVRMTCKSKHVSVILQKDEASYLNRISVLDDGVGMTFDELCESFIFNLIKKRETGDIGKFHVGMKYALMSLGSQITIISRVANGSIVGIFADIDQMVDCNTYKPTETCDNVDDEWAIRHISPKLWDKFKNSSSGTMVDVKNLVPSCRSQFTKIKEEVEKGIRHSYTSLYNDCSIVIEDGNDTPTVCNPSDLFYKNDETKLDYSPYKGKFYIYDCGGRSRVIEEVSSKRSMPNKEMPCGTPENPIYYEHIEKKLGVRGKQNTMRKVNEADLPPETELGGVINYTVVQVKDEAHKIEKKLFPRGGKLHGDRKGFWFERDIRCVSAANQLGHKFGDRSIQSQERQRMLVEFNSNTDSLIGLPFNKQMRDGALPCAALNDAFLTVYKQVTGPWDREYVKDHKAQPPVQKNISDDEDEDTTEDDENAENAILQYFQGNVVIQKQEVNESVVQPQLEVQETMVAPQLEVQETMVAPQLEVQEDTVVQEPVIAFMPTPQVQETILRQDDLHIRGLSNLSETEYTEFLATLKKYSLQY